ncbi:MAG: glucose-1-phosphate adenylyltransferase [Candidatus Eisenbacteria bacterium]|nr:glucose-1-phosphate adenylyltransferase [Candidatus Eisenbacteria bacterium]
MEAPITKPLRLVAMTLAGGRVGELSVLTLRRPKSALPFAGYYRVIDFPLSNLMRAGIHNVGILSQYRPASLIDHVGVGESWDFVGLGRGAKILPPFRGAEASDWYRGNADAVFQNLNYVRDHQADLLLILSGDHIYSMDYRKLVEFHLERGADMTIAVKRMDPHERFGWAVLDADGRVTDYEEKPVVPKSDLASLTVYLVNVAPLTQILRELNGRQLIEFGRDVLPAMIARHRVYGWVFDGYWAYTRTVESYYQAHQDLLSGRIDIDEWGVRTNLHDTMIAGHPPAHIGRGATIENSFISSGTFIEGRVENSVLSPAVVVERGATVRSSIILHRCVIRAGARVERAIMDKSCEIGPDARVGLENSGEITLLGKECQIGRGGEVSPGTTLQPEEQVLGSN